MFMKKLRKFTLMSILGVSAFHHDSAAALVHEERFTRVKYDKNWPEKSISYLQSLDNKIDTVAFYDKEKPKKHILDSHVLEEFCSDDMIKNTCVEELYNFADDCYYSEDMTPIYNLIDRYKKKVEKK